MGKRTGEAKLGWRRGGGLLLLLLLLLLTAVPKSTAQANCNYTILVETTCAENAGTGDQVSLRFGDSSSTDILVRRLRTKHVKMVDGSGPATLDDEPRMPFRACSTDAFTVTGECIRSRICYLYLKLRGSDDWRPGRVQVLVPSATNLSSETFYFRRYLPRQVWHGLDACEAEVTPFGVRHKRRVFGKENRPKLS